MMPSELIESEPAKKPKILYHGTNIIAAAEIMHRGVIDADEPIDGEFAVVCTTSKRKLGRMFAVEFLRTNSELEVGAIFILDGQRIMQNHSTEWHEAETAGCPEFEYRIEDDVRLADYLLGIRLVGNTRILQSDRARLRIWDDNQRRFKQWMSFLQFDAAIDKLLAASRKPA